MKYILKPSLHHMALIKILVILWNQHDVRDLITKIQNLYFDKNEEWQIIEDRIREKVSEILLPQTLKKQLLDFIRPIGLQILEWMQYHRRGFYLHLDLPAEFCWSPQGTIDKKKTAEVLIKDKKLYITTRYRLACMYCLEEDIQKLWYEMPENLKHTFSDEDSLERDNWYSVVFFWSCNMKRKELGNPQPHTSYKSAFQSCVIHGNKTAAEYFLQRLTPRERGESLVKMAKCADDPDVLCFLLSELDEEEKIEVFKNNPYAVFRCFLNWPLQSFFIKIADHMLDILSKKDYIYSLERIIDKVENRQEDWNYKKLLREYWQKSPNSLKSFNADDFKSGCLLSILFRIRDKENLSLILKGVTPTEKKKLIYSVYGQTYCHLLIHNNQCDLFEYFIKSCLPLRDEEIKFKQKL